VYWNNPVPVVAGIVEHDGLIILARNKLWPEKMFGLITGYLEQGESPEASIRREIKEELNLDSLKTSLVGVYPFLEKNEVLIAYHALTSGEITMGEELAEIKAIPPHKLKPWRFGTGYAVSDWLKSINND
jgi:NADH pyrophosphatase NudC (nudix superfamily)